MEEETRALAAAARDILEVEMAGRTRDFDRCGVRLVNPSGG